MRFTRTLGKVPRDYEISFLNLTYFSLLKVLFGSFRICLLFLSYCFITFFSFFIKTQPYMDI